MCLFMMTKLISSVFFIVFSVSTFAMSHSRVGVVCAVSNEAKPFIRAMTLRKKKTIHHIPYMFGKVGSQDIVLAISGVGSVNSAVVTTSMIRDFNPKYIIFSGSAGSVNSKLNIGDVVVSKSIYALENSNPELNVPRQVFRLNPIRNANQPIYYLGSKFLLSYVKKIKSRLNLRAHNRKGKLFRAQILSGKIASSDHFPNNKNDLSRMRYNSVDVVAMEGASMMQVCWLFQKDCLVVRGVSNVAAYNGKNSNLKWNKRNATLAEKNAGQVTIELIKSIKFLKN